jgi:HSP20 family protein
MGEGFAPLIDREHFLGRSGLGMSHRYRHPQANIVSDEAEYTLELSVPGFKREELELTIANELLYVTGKRATKQVSDQRYLLNEFGVESFERIFKLSPALIDDKIEAQLTDGILRIVFRQPVAGEVAAEQHIAVQ